MRMLISLLLLALLMVVALLIFTQRTTAIKPTAERPLSPSLFHPIVFPTPRLLPTEAPPTPERVEARKPDPTPSAQPRATSLPMLRATPKPSPKPKPTIQVEGLLVAGAVSWYPASGLIAAAHSWHWGDTPYPVRVCAGPTCITVTVQDYCQGCTHGRLLDLSDDAFRLLAPLSAGVVRATAYGWR